MTQEELDALMDEDMDSVEIPEERSISEDEASIDEGANLDPDEYRAAAATKWPPPPPTTEHRMVHQLDEVTEDSEKKAGEVFDILDLISGDADNIEGSISTVRNSLASVKETFETLNKKFPAIEAFKTELENLEQVDKELDAMVDASQNIVDQTMMAMDVMQYQDIHRQKIERVINVMRALSGYMNSLFASNKDDKKRVSSAVHLVGDDTENVVGEEDIEALIASFGQK